MQRNAVTDVMDIMHSMAVAQEQLLLAVELRDPHVYPESLASSLRCYVEKEHGLAVWGLVLLRPRSLPKTTSGKLQHRQACGNENHCFLVLCLFPYFFCFFFHVFVQGTKDRCDPQNCTMKRMGFRAMMFETDGGVLQTYASIFELLPRP